MFLCKKIQILVFEYNPILCYWYTNKGRGYDKGTISMYEQNCLAEKEMMITIFVITIIVINISIETIIITVNTLNLFINHITKHVQYHRTADR